MASSTGSQNPVVTAILSGSAPRAAQVAASRGLLPLPQADLLEILVTLGEGSDGELKQHALETLATQTPETLDAAVRSSETAPRVLSYFVRQPSLPAAIHEALLLNPLTPPVAIARFASTTRDASLLDLLSFNQQLLIGNPDILDALIANSYSSDAQRRAAEIKREFFEKERGAQQIANELRARGNEAAAEFIERAEFAVDLDDSGLSLDDAMFIAAHIEVLDRETDDSWMALEYIEEIYEETDEQRKAAIGKIIGEMQVEEDGEIPGERISMINRVMKMGVKDRVKLGQKGDREARNILIRDPNRLVSSAVVNNPKITEQEVETIASMRSVPEDILRQIAGNRQWARSYNIQHMLAKNPRTPMANIITIMSRLQLRDLAALAKNRNVADATRRQAQRLHSARTGAHKK